MDRVAKQVEADAFEALTQHRAFAEELLGRLGQALDRNRRTGAAFYFSVAVDPSGRAQMTKVKPSARPNTNDSAASPSPPKIGGQVLPAEIFKDGDMLSAEQFAALIGASPVTVYERRRKNRVLGLDGAKRGFRFPKWQLDLDGKPFAALPALFERLGGDVWSVYHFMLQRHPKLEGSTAVEALRRGRTALVLRVAESMSRGRIR